MDCDARLTFGHTLRSLCPPTSPPHWPALHCPALPCPALPCPALRRVSRAFHQTSLNLRYVLNYLR